MVNKRIQLDFTEEGLRENVEAVQGDTGRTLLCHITGVDMTGVSARFYAVKKSGKEIYNNCSVSGNNVTVELTEQTLAETGIVKCQLDLRKGSQKVQSFIFNITVTASLAVQSEYLSSNEYKVVDDLAGEVEDNKNKIAELDDKKANKDDYGSPLTASTVSAMTDKKKVYVYTGSESGYTAGNWYSWDGSKWVSGGVYNSAAIQTDETLTQSGKAADSAIVGRKINQLTLELENVAVTDKSITEKKLSDEVVNRLLPVGIAKNEIIPTFTRVYADPPGYFGGVGSYGSQYIQIDKIDKILALSTVSTIVWYAYKKQSGDTPTYVYKNTQITDELWKYASYAKINGFYTLELDLSSLKKSGIKYLSIGFNGKNFDQAAQKIYEVTGSDESVFSKIGILKENDKLVNPYFAVNSGYSGTLKDQYGQNINLFKGNKDGFIDVSENKILYMKVLLTNQVNVFKSGFGCYNAANEFLFLSTAEQSGVLEEISFAGIKKDPYFVTDDGQNCQNIAIAKITFPENVKKVILSPKISEKGFSTTYLDKRFILGYDPILDYKQTYDDYMNKPGDEFKEIVEAISGSADKKDTKKVLFIGDSLTNWGGGTDETDGFLKIVHEKTGVFTTNWGYAGATWQDMSGQTYSGVQRIDTLVSSGEKYDMYVFILGTNGASAVDTGSTSTEHSADMCGGIRYCLEKLKEYDPTAQIMVCLPPQRKEGNDNQEKGNTIIKSISGSYSVPTLDLFHDSGIVSTEKISSSTYLQDGLHLASNGTIVLGNLLSSAIKYYLCL